MSTCCVCCGTRSHGALEADELVVLEQQGSPHGGMGPVVAPETGWHDALLIPGVCLTTDGHHCVLGVLARGTLQVVRTSRSQVSVLVFKLQLYDLQQLYRI